MKKILYLSQYRIDNMMKNLRSISTICLLLNFLIGSAPDNSRLCIRQLNNDILMSFIRENISVNISLSVINPLS